MNESSENPKKSNTFKKALLWSSGLTALAANVLAYTQASRSMKYRKEHSKLSRYIPPETLELVLGKEQMRPENEEMPSQPHEHILFQGKRGQLEGWLIPATNPKGTILIFHGYTRQKSYMLEKSDEMVAMGYNTFLIDFIGSGGSEGVQTSIGYHEATDVTAAFQYIQTRFKNENATLPIYLFGSSMGAVAILKAIYDDDFQPDAILIECPFASMYQAVANRFKLAKIPTFPLAPLLVFWGGAQNWFWGFGHLPTKYAQKVQCPVLLMYGEQDEKVNRSEIDAIYNALNTTKELVIFPNAGHSDYFEQHRSDWANTVSQFLTKLL